MDLDVDRAGRLWMIFRRGEIDRYRIASGGDEWTIVNPYGTGEREWRTTNDKRVHEVRFIGFDSDGIPLVLMRFSSGADVLYRGSERLWEAEGTYTKVVGICPERDAYLCTLPRHPSEPCRLWIMNYTTGARRHVELPGWEQVRKAFLAPGGAIYAIGHDPALEIGVKIARAEGSGLRQKSGMLFSRTDRDACDLVFFHGEVHLVISRKRDDDQPNKLIRLDQWDHESMWTTVEREQELIGPNLYHRHFTQLVWQDSYAYIGKRLRHGLGFLYSQLLQSGHSRRPQR